MAEKGPGVIIRVTGAVFHSKPGEIVETVEVVVIKTFMELTVAEIGRDIRVSSTPPYESRN